MRIVKGAMILMGFAVFVGMHFLPAIANCEESRFFLAGEYRVFFIPLESKFYSPTTPENIEQRAAQIFASDNKEFADMFQKFEDQVGEKLPAGAEEEIRVKVFNANTGKNIYITSGKGVIVGTKFFSYESGKFSLLFGLIVREMSHKRYLISGPKDVSDFGK